MWESPFIQKRCQILQPSAEIGTLIDQFYKYRRYSVTITLQVEKYSLSFAHIGNDAPWKSQILILK